MAVAAAVVAATDPGTALGLGLLWRPALAPLISEAQLGFVEMIAESVGPELAGDLPAGITVVPHGVGLGLGGAEPPDRARLARLAAAATTCRAPLVSEHLAFVRAGGMEAGHLLPIPRTRAALDVLVANVGIAVDSLPVPLALEPIATLVEWPGAELTELDFLLELLERTDADLVLDVANLVVNAANRRRAGGSGPDADPLTLVEQLPLDRVAYVHAAGGRVIDGRHHDTHLDPLWPEVETLVEELWSRHEIPGLLLERDGNLGDPAPIEDELSRLRVARDNGRRRRVPRSTGVLVPGCRGRPRHPGTRTGLAVAQVAFLRAVSGDGVPPAGFDRDDLDAVALVLARKRAAAVTHAVPDVGALPAFAERFVDWARHHPSHGAVADAAAFLRWLPRQDRTVHACLAVAHRRASRLQTWPHREGVVVGLSLGPWRLVRSL